MIVPQIMKVVVLTDRVEASCLTAVLVDVSGEQ